MNRVHFLIAILMFFISVVELSAQNNQLNDSIKKDPLLLMHDSIKIDSSRLVNRHEVKILHDSLSHLLDSLALSLKNDSLYRDSLQQLGVRDTINKKDDREKFFNRLKAKGWTTKGVTTIQSSQISFTNWAKGGENAFNIHFTANPELNYKSLRGNVKWNNILSLAYGTTMRFDDDFIIQKNDDKIDFSSKFGLTAKKKWNYSSMVSFKSQFASGYKYPNDSVIVSNWLAPANILIAIGMDYIPNKEFTLLVSPLTAKMTIVNDQGLANKGSFGVEPAVYLDDTVLLIPGRRFRSEIGGFLKLHYNKKVSKNLTISNKFELFSNYLEEPQNIDVSWELLVTYKLSKYITASFSSTLLYDDDIMIPLDTDNDGVMDGEGPRVQFKEIFGLGFTYKI